MSLIDTAAPQAAPRASAPDARVELLRELKNAGYAFVTPSVSTHRRVVRRSQNTEARGLRDIFGWNLPFEPHVLSPRLLDLLTRGDLVRASGDLLRSRVRAASLGQDLFLHSAFPTNDPDSVFFGPDTYRFANFLREELRAAPGGGVVVDVGAGSGAGAIVVARNCPATRLVLTDTNPRALDLAAANLSAAGLSGETVLSNGLENLKERADLIVANPPFIAGSSGHAYRDGGDLYGCRLSLEWTLEAIGKVKLGGRLMLYTGSAVVDGQDVFRTELEARLEGQPVNLSYRELDPDIFGSLLNSNAYADVERIAAVGLVVTRL